jgi:hypothetical protein
VSFKQVEEGKEKAEDLNMEHKTSPWRAFLLLVASITLLISIFPLDPVDAAVSPRSFDESFDLMNAARGILLEEDIEEGDEVARAPVLFSMRADVPANSPADQILIRLINATKRELGELEKACREARRLFSEEEKKCEEQLSRVYCDMRISELRNRLSFLRKVRGDRRKALTKAWHAIKRAGANIWRNIGPIGRRFLRELGSDVKSVIMSGGSLHGGVLRSLILKRVRSIAREELEKMGQRGLQRMIGVQAQAAGDDCEALIAEETSTEQDSEACLEEDWFDQAWSDIELLLIAEGRNCQTSAIYELEVCLLEQAAAGVCQDEAVEACQGLFDATPKNDAGGSVTMTGETVYGGAVYDEVNITYPSDGGIVSGFIQYQLYDDVFICTITTVVSLIGEYNPETCSIRGTAEIDIDYDGQICVSVCGVGPNAPEACPVTVSGSTVWEAFLEDGVLSGEVGGESCDPHCFGFQAPGYGSTP